MSRTSPWGAALWPFAVGASGGLLLLVSTLEPVASSLYAGSGLVVTGLAILAAVSLIVGLITGWSWLLLFLFPIALLPPIALAPSAVRQNLLAMDRWLLWIAIFGVYSWTAALWLARGARDSDETVRRTPLEARTTRGWVGDALRLGAAIALLAAPLVVASYPSADPAVLSVEGRVFVQLLLLFSWSIAYFFFFLSPLLGERADVHALRKRMHVEWQRVESRAARRQGRRARWLGDVK